MFARFFTQFFKKIHCVKCRNFGEIRPKLCGNCALPQNFHTRKLGEITVFYALIVIVHDQNIRNNKAITTNLKPNMKFSYVSTMMVVARCKSSLDPGLLQN